MAESKDTASKDTASKDTASKDTASKDTASKYTASKDTASKDTATKDTASKDAASKDTASKDTASKDTAAQGVGKTSAAAADAGRSAADAGGRQVKDGARAAEAVTDRIATAARAAAPANTDILRGQVETAQQAVRSSLEAGARSFEGLTQNWTRAFGAPAPNGDLAQQSAQNVEAVSQASTALAKGAQDASRAWLELTQRAVRTNLEALSQLAGCRTVQEVVTLQSNLLRDNLQQAIESGEVIARLSSDAIREATRVIHPNEPRP